MATITGVLNSLRLDRGVETVQDLWRDIRDSPPDVFALTALVLSHTGAYQKVVSPPGPDLEPWPPPDFANKVREITDAWTTYLNDRLGSDPDLPRDASPPQTSGDEVRGSGASGRPAIADRLADWFDCCEETLLALEDLDRSSLVEEGSWPVLRQLLEMHACADEVCRGLGIPITGGRKEPFKQEGEWRLPPTGTASRFDPRIVRVLPKLRTPQVGMTLRTLSHHLTACETDVDVKWHWQRSTSALRHRERRMNVLVVPWPFEVHASAFQSTQGPLSNLPYKYGFFSFNPGVTEDDPVQLVRDAVAEANGNLLPGDDNRVHCVILPEGALTRSQAEELESALEELSVEILLTGIRGDRTNLARLSFPSLDASSAHEQPKHHRWQLDTAQVKQYGLGWALEPNRNWWEDIEFPGRRLHFVCLSGWFCMCHLICEDLARMEPGAEIIRAVGPNLVVALLLDGPQLERRWPGRYASVFTEDPGSSVLTLTSWGMVERSNRKVTTPSRVVALWKDPVNGAKELELPEGSCGLLLTLTPRFVTEWSADGRSDGGTAAQLILGDHLPVQRSGPGAAKSEPPSDAGSAPPVP